MTIEERRAHEASERRKRNRRVWVIASTLQREKRLTVANVMCASGLGSLATQEALKDLQAMGYAAHERRHKAQAWSIVVPFVLVGPTGGTC